MLEDFLHTNEIDVICLQEVTKPYVTNIRNYTAHVNIGTEGRGTAILHKNCYEFSNIEKMPTRRGILGTFHDMKILNVYAPSDTTRRQEREEFFETVIPRFRLQVSKYHVGVGEVAVCPC
jgi:exonuclease III